MSNQEIKNRLVEAEALGDIKGKEADGIIPPEVSKSDDVGKVAELRRRAAWYFFTAGALKGIKSKKESPDKEKEAKDAS